MTKLLTVDLRWTTDENRTIPHPFAKAMMTDRQFAVRLNLGKSYANDWEAPHLDVEDHPDAQPGLTDYIPSVPFEIVSIRFTNLLRSLGCDCEFLPLVVHYNGKVLEAEYFALNVLQVLPSAVDLKRSVFDRYIQGANMARGVSKLVLDESLTEAYPMSFLREITSVAVNESVAQGIIQANLVGIHLMKPGDYRS